ncbi:MAG: DUF1330 domain-containing protein [Deltaproteobacteria bacterium]|nr:MAG: DUF1330 domain-containing protein [Deltaproteobacteria bacterium]
MMPTYSIVGVTVTDPELFQRYVDGHGATLTEFGGRFLAAGEDFETIEGAWPGQITVVHEWPNRGAFHAWYASEAYRPWKEMRHAAASTNLVLIDGLPVVPDTDAD